MIIFFIYILIAVSGCKIRQNTCKARYPEFGKNYPHLGIYNDLAH